MRLVTYNRGLIAQTKSLPEISTRVLISGRLEKERNSLSLFSRPEFFSSRETAYLACSKAFLTPSIMAVEVTVAPDTVSTSVP